MVGFGLASKLFSPSSSDMDELEIDESDLFLFLQCLISVAHMEVFY